VQPTVTDVERLKKMVRKTAAAQVLSGGTADVRLDLALVGGCRARIAAGYGPLTQGPLPAGGDRLIWILDGYAEVHDAAGQVTHVSQGESAALAGNVAYRLVFPQLTLYLSVEGEGTR